MNEMEEIKRSHSSCSESDHDVINATKTTTTTAESLVV